MNDEATRGDEGAIDADDGETTTTTTTLGHIPARQREVTTPTTPGHRLTLEAEAPQRQQRRATALHTGVNYRTSSLPGRRQETMHDDHNQDTDMPA